MRDSKINIKTEIMSTPNFLSINTKNIYAIEVEDRYAYDDFIEALLDALGEHDFDEVDEDDPLSSRSYPGRVIAQKTVTKYIGELSFELTLKVIIRNAYYSGVNLDWHIGWNVNGYESSSDGIKTDLEDLTDLNGGLCSIHADRVQRWYTKSVEELSAQAEDVFDKEATHKLRCVGVFSNGEAIYGEIKTEDHAE